MRISDWSSDVCSSDLGKMADEYLAAIIALWTQDKPEFEGEFVSFKDIGFAPKPLQSPKLPIWLGGDAEAVLKRVAKFGDGWSPFRTPPAKFQLGRASCRERVCQYV